MSKKNKKKSISEQIESSANLRSDDSGAAKIFFIVCAVLLVVLIGGMFVFMGGGSSDDGSVQGTQTASVDESGKQVINITAKGGYKPGVVTAKAGQPSLLKIKTNNSFDCSRAFMIPDLKISRNLPPTGETVIEIPAQEAGKELEGTCSMGMYSFKMKFV
ncbi:MAG: cupredoxin domain-containing protein [Candidatus Dojkabacteria bacterium]|nr:cupredoxin domain-containing protein [Candidatus Dojkabacteria bacterium]